MRGRIGRIALLIFQAVWLNVVLPGHTRGIITLPGSDCADSSSCCASRKTHAKPDAPARPTPRPGACAVCFFAARLSLPETVDLTPPALGLVAIAEIPPAHEIPHAPPLFCFDGRGPPLM